MLNAKASRSRLITGAVAVMLAGALGLAPAAAAGTVSVTSACDRDLVVYGSAGDTIQITLGAGCPNSSDLNTFEASDIGPGLSFLRLAALDGEEAGHDGEPGDVNWGVLRGIRQTTVTVLLLPENANGDPLQAGSLLAVIDEASPRYDITYGGPHRPASPVRRT